ncbi:MAG: hypothetical protein IJ783_06430, partial [Kiritimatiellae bacterium]|nr:hypothetical protein [Kiritimatiellia bacterium]
LAAGGFVEARHRSATRVAARLPFAGRFLLVLEEANADGTSGICENLEKAARETESRRRGVAWDVVWRTPENTPALARDLAAHRWCGAFLRFAHTTSPNWTPGEAALASVPGVPMGVETVYKGTAVSPLVRELHLSDHEPWGEVFAKCAAAGMRRALVLDTPAGRGARDREGEVRTAAAASGVSIPEFGYAVPLSTDTGESIRRLLAMQSRLVRPGDVDAILVRRDDLLHHLAPVLRANWGERAASAVRVVCWSVGTLLADEGLRVEWRGYDIVSTKLSFIDWAEDVRSGARHPAEPRVARA